MALTTYAELNTAIGNWVNLSDLTSYTDDLVTLGEKWIYRNLRTRQMERSITSTIGAATAGMIAVPSDYVALKTVYIDGTPVLPLKRRTLEYIYDQYPKRGSGEKPIFIAREAGNFIFGPFAADGYVVKGTYYRRLEALSASLNGIYTTHPDMYLFAALAETEPFLKNDERVKLWSDKRDAVANQIMKEDIEDNYSGSLLSVSPG